MKAKTLRSGSPLLAVVPICMLLGGCGGGLTRHGPVDPELAALIPPDTVALAGVQVDRIRETPLYRKLAEENRLPRFDSHEILLAADGKNVLGIARGALSLKPEGDLSAT